MRWCCVFVVILGFHFLNGQNTNILNKDDVILVKKLIYEDIWALNLIYRGEIFDTTGNAFSKAEVNDFERIQLLSLLDYGVGIYKIKVRFLLSTKQLLHDVFYDKSVEFEYVIQKFNERLFRIDGFLISDIYLLEEFPYLYSNYLLKYPKKSIRRIIKKKSFSDLSNYFTISVLKVFEKYSTVQFPTRTLFSYTLSGSDFMLFSKY